MFHFGLWHACQGSRKNGEGSVWLFAPSKRKTCLQGCAHLRPHRHLTQCTRQTGSQAVPDHSPAPRDKHNPKMQFLCYQPLGCCPWRGRQRWEETRVPPPAWVHAWPSPCTGTGASLAQAGSPSGHHPRQGRLCARGCGTGDVPSMERDREQRGYHPTNPLSSLGSHPHHPALQCSLEQAGFFHPHLPLLVFPSASHHVGKTPFVHSRAAGLDPGRDEHSGLGSSAAQRLVSQCTLVGEKLRSMRGLN